VTEPLSSEFVRLFRVGLLIFAVIVGFAYGLAAGTYQLFPYQTVRSWVHAFRHESRASSPTAEPAELDDGDRQRLETLGYLPSYEAAPAKTGLIALQSDRVSPGFSFYVSAHAPEAHLVTLNGTTLHSWRYDFGAACPERSVPAATREHPTEDYDSDSPEAWRAWRQGYWRRAALLPGGDALAVFDYDGLIRVDVDSKLRWALCDAYHHDISLDEDGRIYALRRTERSLAEIHPKRAFQDDSIDVLSPEGELLQRVSVVDALRSSPYASHLKRIDRQMLSEHGDILHTNAVKVLGRHPAAENSAFRPGNVLISIKHLDLIAVVDMELEQVVWALSGMWRYQHEPVLLDNGNILVFDNAGRGGRSRVLEFEPATQRIVWSYPQPGDHDLMSGCCGSVRRLSNGNTLITESSPGRALEVTGAGEVVWEWLNPHRMGSDKQIPMLLEVLRIDPASTESWLEVSEASSAASQ
jgi:hypothetical protein